MIKLIFNFQFSIKMAPIFFTNAEEIKHYLPVNVNLRFETLQSHLSLCEENYIRPLLGKDLFNRVAAFLQENETLTDDNLLTEFVHKCRFALVRLAIWKGFDIIASNISDVGVSSEVDKENRLFRYQEENIKSTLKNEGFNYLDNILVFIEANSRKFPDFATSEYQLQIKNSLIRSTADFQKCYDIDNSRLVFLKMRQYIRDVELINLQYRIGADFFKELVNADETLEKYARVLPYFRLFVVYQSVVEGIGELHKLPTDKGLIFESSSIEGVQTAPVYRAQVLETRAQFADKAEKYISAAINIIKLHKEDYPNYFLHAPDDPTDGIIRRDNTNRKTFLT